MCSRQAFSYKDTLFDYNLDVSSQTFKSILDSCVESSGISRSSLDVKVVPTETSYCPECFKELVLSCLSVLPDIFQNAPLTILFKNNGLGGYGLKISLSANLFDSGGFLQKRMVVEDNYNRIFDLWKFLTKKMLPLKGHVSPVYDNGTSIIGFDMGFEENKENMLNDQDSGSISVAESVKRYLIVGKDRVAVRSFCSQIASKMVVLDSAVGSGNAILKLKKNSNYSAIFVFVDNISKDDPDLFSYVREYVSDDLPMIALQSDYPGSGDCVGKWDLCMDSNDFAVSGAIIKQFFRDRKVFKLDRSMG